MKKTRRGFTLIELSIALVFLAILLITIAILTTNIIAIYQKGLSIKAINSTGRELIDDFSRAIAASPSKNITYLCDTLTTEEAKRKCKNDGAYKFVYQQETASGITVSGKDIGALPVRGVFCSGRYSYIWNTGYTFTTRLYSGNTNTNGILRYKVGDNTTVQVWPNATTHKDAYRLLKLEDQDRVLCAAHINKETYETENKREYNITATPLVSEPEEMLAPSEDNLALYDFRMFRPSQHITTMHSFFSGTFILATIAGGVNITGAGDYCSEAPAGLATDFSYCAVNKFNFAMRAIGELNDDEKKEKQSYDY